ncbi:glycerophosphodiester phosphodiesterase [Methanogenium cariaci]|uniref:glycerophosphodiester phosphodiesterase n=1 Tax=Methanogenium cariaci TaxID=2197 RepID=UPI0007854BE2|nr:glycerophosphodiester phosphodiesterase [Methanogenium cariaci]
MTEIKESGSEEAVCSILCEYDPDSLWIVSFYPESIRAVKRLLPPRVKTGLICSTDCDDPFAPPVLYTGADAILPRTNTFTQEMVTEAHRQGLSVITWTLNTPPEAYQKVASSGADGWVTDDPCGLRAWVNSPKQNSIRI